MSVSDRETLTRRQSSLSQTKRTLLARWKRGESAQPGQESGIPRRPDPGSAPLSFAQQRLWFLDQLDSGSPAYNQPALVRLEGELDRGALERAFAEIVERHEVLRTAFAVRDEQPRQLIVPRVAVPLPVVDLRRSSPDAARAEAERLIRGAARRPFDLAHPPLLRTLLVRLERDQHLLLLSMHHIVSDGWSDGILIRELGRFYQAFRAGQPSSLPALPICVERSPAMVGGRLRILKAGGAYVPLDPAHPRDRLAAVLEDTPAPLLLSQQDLVPALPAYGGELVLLDVGPDRPTRARGRLHPGVGRLPPHPQLSSAPVKPQVLLHLNREGYLDLILHVVADIIGFSEPRHFVENLRQILRACGRTCGLDGVLTHGSALIS